LNVMPARPGLERGSAEYEALKEERSAVLWAAVERVIPDIRRRTQIQMVRRALLELHASAQMPV
jgi:hypothetical protein